MPLSDNDTNTRTVAEDGAAIVTDFDEVLSNSISDFNQIDFDHCINNIKKSKILFLVPLFPLSHMSKLNFSNEF